MTTLTFSTIGRRLFYTLAALLFCAGGIAHIQTSWAAGTSAWLYVLLACYAVIHHVVVART